MKSYLIIGFFLIFSVFLNGCVSNKSYPSLHTDYTNEVWQREVATAPHNWTVGADSWFLTGDPNGTERADHSAPYSAAISTMSVKAPDFVNVKTNGDFEVQIFGTDGPNTVYIYGPNEAVREVRVDVQGNTLSLMQTKRVRSMQRVIVRIGMRQINNLMQYGCGLIEGIQLRSNNFNVFSSGPGNIYLAGNLNVHQVTQLSNGSIGIFGASTSSLDIRTEGASGEVNVGGSFIGLKSINHRCGGTNINVIGVVPCNAATVYADGAGRISVNGRINFKRVEARGKTRIYAYGLDSQSVYAYVCGNGVIGLQGCTTHLYVDAADYGQFAGRYLCTQDAYVRAKGCSHINVSACDRIFAASSDNSSVYFYGSPKFLSQFIGGYGTVIPIWGPGVSGCSCQRPVVQPISYKGENLSSRSRYHWKQGRLVSYK